MAGSREGGLGQAAQRERFRASLQDAIAGVDIVELQTGRRAAVLELPGVADAPRPRPRPRPQQHAAADETDLTPLLREIVVLRGEMEAARRRDLRLVLAAIVAAAVLVALVVKL
jgi:hypothetical protein